MGNIGLKITKSGPKTYKIVLNDPKSIHSGLKMPESVFNGPRSVHCWPKSVLNGPRRATVGLKVSIMVQKFLKDFSIVQKGITRDQKVCKNNSTVKILTKSSIIHHIDTIFHFLTKKYFLKTISLPFPVNTKPIKTDPEGLNLPLDGEPDLRALETRLKEPPKRDQFLKKLNHFASSGTLQGKPLIVELLSKILSVNLIMSHNWEGTHGKKKLTEYETIFHDCLKTAVGIQCKETFNDQAKKAMRTLQNREHITVSRAKKRLSAAGVVEG